ncbi:hypothetical protein OROMI_000053 [Orobanche minor]
MSEHSSESSIPLDEMFKEGVVEKPDENKLIEEGAFLDPSLDTAGLAAEGGFSLSNVDLGGSDGGGSIGGGGSPEPPLVESPALVTLRNLQLVLLPWALMVLGLQGNQGNQGMMRKTLKLQILYRGMWYLDVLVRENDPVDAIKQQIQLELSIDPNDQLLAAYPNPPAYPLYDDGLISSYIGNGIFDGAKLQLFNLSGRSIKRKARQDEVVERDGVVEGEVTSTRRPRRVSCRHPASNPTEFVTGSEYSDGNEDPSQGSEYTGNEDPSQGSEYNGE